MKKGGGGHQSGLDDSLGGKSERMKMGGGGGGGGKNNFNNKHGSHVAKRIALIWTYTNELPFFFDLAVATLLGAGSDNVDIHVIIPTVPEIYQNKSSMINALMIRRVFFHATSPDDWKTRVKDKLGVTLDYDFSKTHRKIADLKPMLGLLFQDHIPFDDYAYWVYGDNDGFFGSFNHIIDHSVMTQYDVVSGFPQLSESLIMAGFPLRCTGAFTMWRNTNKVNSLFMRSINWRKMLMDGSTVYAFDEQTRPVQEGEENMHQVRNKLDVFVFLILICCFLPPPPPLILY